MTPVAEILTDTLARRKVPCKVVGQREASQATTYELMMLSADTSIRAVSRARDDIAFALGEPLVSMTAAVPARPGVFRVIVPKKPEIVKLMDLPPASNDYTAWIGLDMDNKAVPFNPRKMVHTLNGGTTGGGKTTCANAIIGSLLRTFGPDKLGLVLIDPKRVEMPVYEGLPHLLRPPAYDTDDALSALRGTHKLVDLRFEAMQQMGARDFEEMNGKLAAIGQDPLPLILVVVDELSTLMTASKKEAESVIVGIAQKARAAGIHLLLSTQRPSVDVCTGTIKANVSSRIAFRVSSMTDSRVLLDCNGAERLLGRGDGLLSMDGVQPVRFQSAWPDRDDIKTICDRWR